MPQQSTQWEKDKGKLNLKFQYFVGVLLLYKIFSEDRRMFSTQPKFMFNSQRHCYCHNLGSIKSIKTCTRKMWWIHTKWSFPLVSQWPTYRLGTELLSPGRTRHFRCVLQASNNVLHTIQYLGNFSVCSVNMIGVLHLGNSSTLGW